MSFFQYWNLDGASRLSDLKFGQEHKVNQEKELNLASFL